MNISGLLNSQKYIQIDYQSRFTHAAEPLDNVESRCGAVTSGEASLFPPVSF